jgi:hypothetical protein
MDKFKELNTGAKLVLGATVAFLIVSFFEWFEIGGTLGDAAEAFGADNGINMWHGVGVIAGLVAIVLLVWQAIRLANINFEVGVTPSMITAALAALLLLFTLLRVLFGYSGFDRTIWLWLGLLLAVVIAVGAYLNMQASGESFADIRASMAGAAAAAKGAVDRGDASETTTSATATEPAPAAADDAPAAAQRAADDAAAAADDAADAAADAADAAADTATGDDPPRTA